MQFPWAAERDSLQLYLCTARTELVRLSAVESIFHFLWVNTTTQLDRQTDGLTDVVSDSCSASASASVRCSASASASATAIAIDMVNSFWSDEKKENENENELNKRNEMRSH